MSIALALVAAGCASAPVERPQSMLQVSPVVEVRVDGERQNETLLRDLRVLIETRMRARGFEIGGSLENWRLDVDIQEIDPTRLKNHHRLVVELRIRAVGARGEEYWKYNWTEVTKAIAGLDGINLANHLPLLADAIVARVP